MNNEPGTDVVYAVGSDLSGRNFDNLNLENAVFDSADLSNTRNGSSGIRTHDSCQICEKEMLDHSSAQAVECVNQFIKDVTDEKE